MSDITFDSQSELNFKPDLDAERKLKTILEVKKQSLEISKYIVSGIKAWQAMPAYKRGYSIASSFIGASGVVAYTIATGGSGLIPLLGATGAYLVPVGTGLLGFGIAKQSYAKSKPGLEHFNQNKVTYSDVSTTLLAGVGAFITAGFAVSGAGLSGLAYTVIEAFMTYSTHIAVISTTAIAFNPIIKKVVGVDVLSQVSKLLNASTGIEYSEYNNDPAKTEELDKSIELVKKFHNLAIIKDKEVESLNDLLTTKEEAINLLEADKQSALTEIVELSNQVTKAREEVKVVKVEPEEIVKEEEELDLSRFKISNSDQEIDAIIEAKQKERENKKSKNFKLKQLLEQEREDEDLEELLNLSNLSENKGKITIYTIRETTGWGHEKIIKVLKLACELGTFKQKGSYYQLVQSE